MLGLGLILGGLMLNTIETVAITVTAGVVAGKIVDNK